MPQILAVLTYAAVLGNVFFGAFVAAAPADQHLPWYVTAAVAGMNAAVHMLPSDGLPMPGKTAAKISAVLLLLFVPLLSGCSSLGLSSASTPAQVVQAGNLVVNQAACQLQSDANAAGAIASAVGDVKTAGIASATSIATGLLCMQLAPVPPTPAAPATKA